MTINMYMLIKSFVAFYILDIYIHDYCMWLHGCVYFELSLRLVYLYDSVIYVTFMVHMATETFFLWYMVYSFASCLLYMYKFDQYSCQVI